jgi:hypothetical protein
VGKKKRKKETSSRYELKKQQNWDTNPYWKTSCPSPVYPWPQFCSQRATLTLQRLLSPNTLTIAPSDTSLHSVGGTGISRETGVRPWVTERPIKHRTMGPPSYFSYPGWRGGGRQETIVLRVLILCPGGSISSLRPSPFLIETLSFLPRDSRPHFSPFKSILPPKVLRE